MSKLIRTVLETSDDIQNGRDARFAVSKLKEEFHELKDEVLKKEAGEPLGKDGIFGEAVDVIQCAIDVVRLEYPEMTHEEIIAELEARMVSKCEKWRRKYTEAEVARQREAQAKEGD